MITTQKEIRRLFWQQHPTLSRKKIRAEYPTDTRCAFCDFLEYLYTSGQISEALAYRATL